MTQESKDNFEKIATWVWKGLVVALCSFVLKMGYEIRADVNIMIRERSGIMQQVRNLEKENDHQAIDIKENSKDITNLYREILNNK